MISQEHKYKLKSFSGAMIDIECASHNLKNIGSAYINLEASKDEKANRIKDELKNQLEFIELALADLKNLTNSSNESIC